MTGKIDGESGLILVSRDNGNLENINLILLKYIWRKRNEYKMEEIAPFDNCFFSTKSIISWKILLRLRKSIIKTLSFESLF